MPDSLGQLLPMHLIHTALALAGIGQETTFHENRWHPRTTDDLEATVFHPAIHPPCLVDHICLHQVSQELALRRVIEGLNPSRPPIRSGVEMNTHKDSVTVAIRGGNPATKGHEIRSSRQGRLDPPAIQITRQATRHIEGQVLLQYGTTLGATVMTAMPSINHDPKSRCLAQEKAPHHR